MEKFQVNNDGVLVIPDGVTCIEKDSISITWGKCTELVIPDSVQKISADAFHDFHSSLEKVTLPSRFAHPVTDTYENRMREAKEEYKHSFERIFCDDKGFNRCTDIKHITFTGDEHDLDFRDWYWGNGYTESKYSKMFQFHKPIIRLDGEIKHLVVGEKFYNRNGKCDQYKFHINNFIEDVEVSGTDKWTDEDMLFSAPLPDKKPVDGRIAEFTLSPYTIHHDGPRRDANWNRWSCPISIYSDAVTCIYPVSVPCYESDQHEGCYILLMGARLGEIPFDKLKSEYYPYVIVLESYDFVLDKLKQAGWNKRQVN